tara:strand:- start:97568 stop:98005 length:438 start_codon:yes stop_codon:yes gene_type:complete
MKKIEHSAITGHSAEQMYELVNDIAKYPDFLPWCTHAKVIKTTDEEITGKLEVSKGSLKKTFSTRNILTPNKKMELLFVDGPFKHFDAVWNFDELEADACKVSFVMEYEFDNKMLAFIAGPIFDKIGNDMVDAFIKRAGDIYREG